MANGSHKPPEPGRDASIPTGETVVSDEELLTDPRFEMEDALSGNEDPTLPGGIRVQHRMPVVSAPDNETETGRLSREGLVAVDPAAYRPGKEPAPPDFQDEATAALNLPAALPPFPSKARARPMGSHVGTRSDRAPDAPMPDEASHPTTRLAEPEYRPPSEGPAGFVDPTGMMAPVGRGGSAFDEASLPGGPAHEAPQFVVDEDTFGPNAPLEPGSVMAFGVYRVERILGEGPTTRVYLGTDLRDGAPVALKEFQEPKQTLRSPAIRNLLERFRQGEPPPAVLMHPHSIRLLDFFDDTTRGPVMVMEYIPAGDLQAFLAHRGRPLAPREAAALFGRVCDALAHALDHGVVHGNIQPRNILLTPDAQPKVDLIMPVLMGQPVVRPDEGFAAPEVQAGGPASPASDVYGVGASLYQAVTDPHVAAEGGAAPAEIEPIIAQCVDDLPAHRYSTVRELGADLRELLAPPAPARTTAATASPARAAARPPPRLAMAGGALFVVAVGLVAGVWFATRGPRSEQPVPLAASPSVANAAPEADGIMADAERLEAAGDLLAAAAAYQRLLDTDPGLAGARAARTRLEEVPEYKQALRALRRRIRKASPDDAAQLRADLELLGILEPRDALIDHWRSRLNQSNDKGATGGPVP